MIWEIVSSSVMAGVAITATTLKNKRKSSDHEKIIKIADELGLKTKDEKSNRIRILRSDINEDVSEYVYQMPLGLTFDSFVKHKDAFENGLNVKDVRMFDIRNLRKIRNVKKVDWRKGIRDRNLKHEISRAFEVKSRLNKTVELSYDGLLKFKVYEKGLANMIPFDNGLLSLVKNWEFPVGYTREKLIKHDFDKMQMLVVAGMTRYGKTVALKNIITTLIHNNPNHVEFTLIDLKGGLAFNRYKNCKQVKRVAKNPTETLEVLEAIHEEMLDRQAEFLERGVEDIGEAGYKKRHFVIIDEGAEIAGFTDKFIRERCTHLVGEIARIGAGLSYRMVFATQYPTVDVFPRTIKSNTSAALCFRLKTSGHSQVVLDKKGAEQLEVGAYGRAIYQSDQELVIQTPFISNEFIDEKIEPYIIKKKEEERDVSEELGGYEVRDRYGGE